MTKFVMSSNWCRLLQAAILVEIILTSNLCICNADDTCYVWGTTWFTCGDPWMGSGGGAVACHGTYLGNGTCNCPGGPGYTPGEHTGSQYRLPQSVNAPGSTEVPAPRDCGIKLDCPAGTCTPVWDGGMFVAVCDPKQIPMGNDITKLGSPCTIGSPGGEN